MSNLIDPSSFWMRSYNRNRGRWFNERPADLCSLARQWTLVLLLKTVPKYAFFTFLLFSFFNAIVFSWVTGNTVLEMFVSNNGPIFEGFISADDWIMGVSVGIGLLGNFVFAMLCAVVVVLAIIGGVMWVVLTPYDLAKEKIRARRAMAGATKVEPEGPLSGWGAFKAWFRSKHDKVCIRLEYVGDKERQAALELAYGRVQAAIADPDAEE